VRDVLRESLKRTVTAQVGARSLARLQRIRTAWITESMAAAAAAGGARSLASSVTAPPTTAPSTTHSRGLRVCQGHIQRIEADVAIALADS